MRNIFCFLCAVLLCGAVSTPASAQYLSEDELTRLMAGTSIETTTRETGSDFYITFNADGSLDARIDANGELLDDGKWWTEKAFEGGGIFCHQFDEFGRGSVFCSLIGIDYDGRTLARYDWEGLRREKVWVITNPGPQASAVIAAKKATRIARRSRAAPPAQRPPTAAPDTQPPVIDVPATIAAKGELASITGQIRDISRLIEVTIAGQALYDAIKRPVVLNADQTPQYSDIRAPAMTAATSCSCAGVKGYPAGTSRP